jgi:hypothetical protein
MLVKNKKCHKILSMHFSNNYPRWLQIIRNKRKINLAAEVLEISKILCQFILNFVLLKNSYLISKFYSIFYSKIYSEFIQSTWVMQPNRGRPARSQRAPVLQAAT